MTGAEQLIERLERERRLSLSEYEALILAGRGETGADLRAAAAARAARVRDENYGNRVFVRGIVEFTNICQNDCYYCGIRRSNQEVARYRLTGDDILRCCEAGYGLGMRTFVLQGGEDGWYDDDRMAAIVRRVKGEFPDCAVTLSLGERSRDSYQRLFDAGADRYLLRHETADRAHYRKLHPASMSWEHRMACLCVLRGIGYAVGLGMMVGSPFQTARDLAEDLKLIETFQPDMCGIGPFIPHRDTPFRDQPAGTLEETLYLLSLIRLLCPDVLLPATTALGTIDPRGREKGVAAGANVVMPNLSPGRVRHQYELYDNKICMDDEPVMCRNCLDLRMRTVGCRIVVDRGDRRRADSAERKQTETEPE